MGRRQLSAQEMRCMVVAENVVQAYRGREKAENWAEWADKNKGMSRLLNEAAQLHEESDGE